MPKHHPLQKRASPRLPGDSPAQFARKKNTSESIVRNAIREGSIKAILFNGRYRIPPSEHARWDAIWAGNDSAA